MAVLGRDEAVLTQGIIKYEEWNIHIEGGGGLLLRLCYDYKF